MDFRLTSEQQALVDLSDRLGMTIPKKLGGLERPLIDAVLVIEQIAKYLGVTARIIVETNVGALGCIMAYGSEAQQRETARRILEEGDKPVIGMTEATTTLTRAGHQWHPYALALTLYVKTPISSYELNRSGPFSSSLESNRPGAFH